MIKTLILSVFVCLFTSCVTIQAPQVKRVTNLQTSGLLSGTPTVNFEIQLYNPNSVSLTLTNFSVNVNYGTASLATINTDTTQQIGAMSNFTVPLSFQPTAQQISNILQSGSAILNQTGGARLNGKGTIYLQKFIFGKTFDFSF